MNGVNALRTRLGTAPRAIRRLLAVRPMLLDPERIGLRIVQGLPMPAYLRVAESRVMVLAHDVDAGDGAAAVWLAFGARGRKPVTRTCLYEWDGRAWRPAGGGGGPVDRGFLAGRPAAASSGPSALLTGQGSYGGRVPANPAIRDSVAWFFACEAFRAAAEVAELQVGGRKLNVPCHGYVVVAWKSPGDNPPPRRPRIVAFDGDGNVLTELRPGKYADSATMAQVELYLTQP